VAAEPAEPEPILPEKHDIFFCASGDPQLGHFTEFSAAVDMINSSNSWPQEEHWYSYIGIQSHRPFSCSLTKNTLRSGL
jgi:hypothetical protein